MHLRRIRYATLGAYVCYFVVALLLLTNQIACDTATYSLRSEDTQGADETGMYLDAQTQARAAKAIRDYFLGTSAHMQVQLPGGGDVFNAKELSHMADIRALLRLSRGVIVAGALGVAVLLWARARMRGRLGISAKAYFAVRLQGEGIAFLLLMLLLGIVALGAVMDFRRAFEIFHRILFTNEDWLLDPRTDRLILMMPQELFEGLALRIGVQMGCCALAPPVYTSIRLLRATGAVKKQKRGGTKA